MDGVAHNTANRWQFPLLIQYHLKFPVIKPFVEGGPSFSYISNGHNVMVQLYNNPFDHRMTSSQSNDLIELRRATVAGVTMGFGVDLHPRFLHIRPEFRF
jgi:hypothetical protein